ncbi:hypothetical protein FQR65_LT08148 [Abscondita terminalis]|nr:hypothetical protein FQR65_LT08148 [Abscondita terminalis]
MWCLFLMIALLRGNGVAATYELNENDYSTQETEDNSTLNKTLVIDGQHIFNLENEKVHENDESHNLENKNYANESNENTYEPTKYADSFESIENISNKTISHGSNLEEPFLSYFHNSSPSLSNVEFSTYGHKNLSTTDIVEKDKILNDSGKSENVTDEHLLNSDNENENLHETDESLNNTNLENEGNENGLNENISESTKYVSNDFITTESVFSESSKNFDKTSNKTILHDKNSEEPSSEIQFSIYQHKNISSTDNAEKDNTNDSSDFDSEESENTTDIQHMFISDEESENTHETVESHNNTNLENESNENDSNENTYETTKYVVTTESVFSESSKNFEKISNKSISHDKNLEESSPEIQFYQHKDISTTDDVGKDKIFNDSVESVQTATNNFITSLLSENDDITSTEMYSKELEPSADLSPNLRNVAKNSNLSLANINSNNNLTVSHAATEHIDIEGGVFSTMSSVPATIVSKLDQRPIKSTLNNYLNYTEPPIALAVDVSKSEVSTDNIQEDSLYQDLEDVSILTETFDDEVTETAENIFIDRSSTTDKSFPKLRGILDLWLHEQQLKEENEENTTDFNAKKSRTRSGSVHITDHKMNSSSDAHKQNLDEVKQVPCFYGTILDDDDSPCIVLNSTLRLFQNSSEIRLLDYNTVGNYQDNTGYIIFYGMDESKKLNVSIRFNIYCSNQYCSITATTITLYNTEKKEGLTSGQNHINLFKADYGFVSENRSKITYMMEKGVVFEIDHATLYIAKNCKTTESFSESGRITHYKEIIGGAFAILALAVVVAYLVIRSRKKQKLILES